MTIGNCRAHDEYSSSWQKLITSTGVYMETNTRIYRLTLYGLKVTDDFNMTKQTNLHN